jgi:hypothetical protein
MDAIQRPIRTETSYAKSWVRDYRHRRIVLGSYYNPALSTRISSGALLHFSQPALFYIQPTMSLLQHRPLIRATRLGYPVCARLAPHLQYSSGSPTATPIPDDYFNKTGQKAASDPALINMRTDEYSKSGGDDVVAEQVIASFKVYNPVQIRTFLSRYLLTDSAPTERMDNRSCR